MTGYTRHMRIRKTNKNHKICEACRMAARKHSHEYRKQRILNGARQVPRITSKGNFRLDGGLLMVDSIGSRRRLMALAALGYSWNDLGDRLGQSGNNLGYTVRHRKHVMRETHDKISALYEELSMIPAPVVHGVKVVQLRARRKGWVGPLAWDDDTIDDLYALPVGLTREQAFNWFWHTATMTERIQWVLEYGLGITRARWYTYHE